MHAEHTGVWKDCELGDSYDLNDVGMWVLNERNSNTDKNSLNVGRNASGVGIYVVIGTKDVKGEWKSVRNPPSQYQTEILHLY